MLRAALATVMFAALVATICSGSASGAFPGTNGKIAFVNDRNGSPSIFTTDVSGANVERLVPNNPQGAFAAASPSGRKILFSVRILTKLTYSYELWTMNGDGSHIGRFLVEASDRPLASAWSPNGAKVAFYRNGSLWIVNANRSGARELTSADFSGAAPSWSRRGRVAFDRAGSIWVISPKSGKEIRIGPGSQPSWSPDGRKLLFVAVPKDSADNDIFVIRANGHGKKQLTKTPNANETQPAWSPGGRLIAFSGNKGIYVMKSNATRVRIIAAKGLQPSWAKGASGLVYTRQTARWSGFILRTDLSGKHTRWLLRPRVDASPTWSPDGSQLAFTRGGVVYLVDQDGQNPRSTGLKGADPAWSPNGEHLVVTSGLDLAIANGDGTNPASLGLKFDREKFTELSEPDWTLSRTGVNSIAFVATSTAGLQSIFTLELQTKSLGLKETSLSQLPLGCTTLGARSPSWSPSGSLIAFACDQSIAFSTSDGSTLSPLGSAENASLAWAPDGSQIVYSRQFGDHWAQLNVMNSDGTVPVVLDTGPGSSDQPDWQPLP
jgi:Tol biopolymer transport system component